MFSEVSSAHPLRGNTERRRYRRIAPGLETVWSPHETRRLSRLRGIAGVVRVGLPATCLTRRPDERPCAALTSVLQRELIRAECREGWTANPRRQRVPAPGADKTSHALPRPSSDVPEDPNVARRPSPASPARCVGSRRGTARRPSRTPASRQAAGFPPRLPRRTRTAQGVPAWAAARELPHGRH